MTQQQKMVPTQRNMQNKISALQVRFPRDASASLFVFYEQTVKKWIFGEADFFPGLVVDKFEDVLVVQSLALGIDRWKELILDLIKKILAEDGIMIRGVYERSDAKVRKQEGYGYG